MIITLSQEEAEQLIKSAFHLLWGNHVKFDLKYTGYSPPSWEVTASMDTLFASVSDDMSLTQGDYNESE